MIWLVLVLSILSVYRVSRMLATEEGPFALLARWRDVVGQESWLGRGFHCQACVSFWAGLTAALWVSAFGFAPWPLLPLFWCAVSGGAVLLYRLIG